MRYTWLFVLYFSIVQAVLSTFFSLLLALPVAHFFYRFSFPGKRMLLAGSSVFFILSTKLVATAITTCFGIEGLWGIVLAHIMLNLPFVSYLLYLTYYKLDLTIMLSAYQLGATAWQCYRTVIMPFLLPTIFSTALIVFLLCFSSFSIPFMLGTAVYHMTPSIMMSQFYKNGNVHATFGYYLMRLFVVGIVCSLFVRFSNGVCAAHQGHCPMEPQRYMPKRHGRLWLVYLACIAYLILLPLASLLIRCMHTSSLFFLFMALKGDVDTVLGTSVLRIITNSLMLALVASTGSVVLGYSICRLVMHQRGIQQRIVGTWVSIVSFLVGSVGLGLIFSWLSSTIGVPAFFIAVMCHMLLNYPFAYRTIAAQWFYFQSEWRCSAQSLGASWAHIIRTLELPFLRLSVRKAWCISFGLSLVEVGAGSVLEKATGMTIPMAMHIYRQHGIQEGVYGLSLIILIIVFMLAYAVVET